jgi:hypothetical protein
MTRGEFIQLFRRENGYDPDQETIESMSTHYDIDDDGLPPPRQQSRVFQFNNRNNGSNNNDPVNDLFREIKNIFGGIAGSSKRAADKDSDSDMVEFGFMLLVFLLKTGLYFSLKTAYSKGFDFANL